MSTLHHSSAGADAPTQPHPTVRAPRVGPGHPQPPPNGRQARRAAADAARRVHQRRRRRWIRRGITLVFVGLLIPTVWSYYRAVSAPGSDPVTIRSVEWLKDHGMNGVVLSIEHWWYTHNPPPVGGKLKHGLPHAAALGGSAHAKNRATAPATPAHLPPPVAIQPLVTSPLAGEGAWTPTGRTVQGLPAVYTSFFRPDALHTSYVAGAMWMDTTLLKAELVPGLQQPGGPSPWGGLFPLDQRPSLVAAFNSAFKVDDSHGGYYNFGHEYRPLVPGVASLVIDTNGKASVGVWGRDYVMSPSIQTVRQNLSLLVDNAQLVPGLASDSNSKWGATVGNNVFVWRSGAGIDRNGGLIYVGGPGLSVESLAILLQRAGAIRAMELDINSAYVTAYTFQQADPVNPAVVHGVKLLPNMQRTDDRYLIPGERDFFALLAAH